MIRVLIVEDSPAVQRVLTTLLEEEMGIHIVGVASNGQEAIRLCRETRPDLVTMDIYMPEMDGLEATRQIMESYPTRIVIISSMLQSKNAKTFKAIHSGAVDVIEKPHGILTGDYSKVKEDLARIIKQLMEANPERRFSNTPEGRWTGIPESEGARHSKSAGLSPETVRSSADPGEPQILTEMPKALDPKIICIAGSTGAPAILCDILTSLPADYHVPIVIAQHISKGFMKGMVEWLDSTVGLRVKVAKTGDVIRPGMALFGPDDAHLMIGASGVIRLQPPDPKDSFIPSVNRFFHSVANSYGRDAFGVILSGMGNDGTEGMLQMHAKGAVTVGQDEHSSVIYGMPKEAWMAGAVIEQMNPSQIISLFKRLYTRSKRSKTGALHANPN